MCGKDLTEAVKDFFISGKLLKQINTTTLTLIPQKQNPSSVTEYRPMACCNVIYKIIAKIICVRLKTALNSLVDQRQAAFLEGRNILHNVLICQDLMKHYRMKGITPWLALKVDIKKAYDALNWDFIENMMKTLSFPRQFIIWVMQARRTVKYSISVNGGSFGFFEDKSGLRQGDPISPLIFVMCMEYLIRCLKLAGMHEEFQFHPQCKTMQITHLNFADDIILFARGNIRSVEIHILKDFPKLLGWKSARRNQK